MLSYSSGNILESTADVLVNPVNCVGIMGKGLALQFKQAFPSVFLEYQTACRSSLLRPGRCLVSNIPGQPDRYIAHVPTKRHWRDPSRIADVQSGLLDLVDQLAAIGARSAAVPPVGCGLGGLLWQDVEPLILSAFAKAPQIDLFIFGGPAQQISQSPNPF